MNPPENATASTPPALPLVFPEVRRVYQLFSALHATAAAHFHASLGGKLLLLPAFDTEGSALALAASIAGAASLSIDPDQARLKQALRHGIIDFMVNHLDEALRILKNEIRKEQPVCVALSGERGPAIAEMIARGVQPDLLDAAKLPPEAQRAFAERGAISLTHDFKFVPGMIEVEWTAAEPSWLPRADALAAETLGSGEIHAADPASDNQETGNDARLRWLRLAPRYLGRTLHLRRYLVMNSLELSRFATLAATLRDASGQPAVQIRSTVV